MEVPLLTYPVGECSARAFKTYIMSMHSDKSSSDLKGAIILDLEELFTDGLNSVLVPLSEFEYFAFKHSDGNFNIKHLVDMKSQWDFLRSQLVNIYENLSKLPKETDFPTLKKIA